MPPPPSDPGRGTGLLVVAWPLAEGDIAGLCERLQRVITTSDAHVVVCDVGDLPPNCRAIDALARLQLTARRMNRRIHLQRASPAMQELLGFAGLAEVLPMAKPC